jgi:hypothetical protein
VKAQLGSLIVACAVFIFCSAAGAQEWTCTAPLANGGIRFDCESGKGCWVIARENGSKSHAGCIQGRDVALFTPVSGEFKNIPLGDAVTFLTRGRNLEVKVLGDSKKLISFSTPPLPLQLVLLDLQRTAGVPLETEWLPQIGADEEFSVCVNARVSEAALLFRAIGGRAIQVPEEKRETRVNLKLRGVNLQQATDELLKALQ